MIVTDIRESSTEQVCSAMSTNEPAPDSVRKRRPRYRGTHPQRFHEKYKELNPEKYFADVNHVLGRGQTPAGMHRPVCVDEILSILLPKPGDIMFDATLGYGGHTRELLKRIVPGGKLYATDVDPVELKKTESRLRSEGFSYEQLVIRKMNFAGIGQLLADVPAGFDGICADLGVSSMQLDNPERGFSYKTDGPLDLRLNPEKGVPASAFLKTVKPEQLTAILTENADEPYADEIARHLCSLSSGFSTTRELSTAIATALSGVQLSIDDVKKSQQRTFMALRIAVNDEFGVLDRFLDVLPWCLRSGRKVAILTFHSGEDRRVKKAFQHGLKSGVYSAVAPTPLRPTPEERRANPRSICAKLRWAERSPLPVC